MFAPMTRNPGKDIEVDEILRDHALRLAGGDKRRLVQLSETEMLVLRTPAVATPVKRARTKGRVAGAKVARSTKR